MANLHETLSACIHVYSQKKYVRRKTGYTLTDLYPPKGPKSPPKNGAKNLPLPISNLILHYKVETDAQTIQCLLFYSSNNPPGVFVR